jgi:hypothetical protein
MQAAGEYLAYFGLANNQINRFHDPIFS